MHFEFIKSNAAFIRPCKSKFHHKLLENYILIKQLKQKINSMGQHF